MKWRSATNVLCDRYINERPKNSKFTVRSSAGTLYGAVLADYIKDNKGDIAAMETIMNLASFLKHID